MKSVVIFDTVFGNTELVAQAVGKELGTAETVSVIHVSDVTLANLEEADLVVVASPTRGFRPMPSIMKFLKDLPVDALIGKKAAVFDTRMDVDKINSKIFRFIVSKGGFADAAIAKQLKASGAKLIEPTAGFFVDDSEGPLTEGELERAVKWVRQIKAGL